MYWHKHIRHRIQDSNLKGRETYLLWRLILLPFAGKVLSEIAAAMVAAGGFGWAPGRLLVGRRCSNSGSFVLVRFWESFLSIMGASSSMEEKKGFYLVCMGVTAEVETRGRGTWPEMCSGWRAQRYLHLGVNWNPKIELYQSRCVRRIPKLHLT